MAKLFVEYIEKFRGSRPEIFVCFADAVFVELEFAALSRGAFSQ